MDSRLSVLMVALKQLNKDKTGSKFAVPKKGTPEFQELTNLIAKESEKKSGLDLEYELSIETINKKYKGLSDTERRLISKLGNYITPSDKPSLQKQANNIYLEMNSIRNMIEKDRYDSISLKSAKHLASVIKQLIEKRPDLKYEHFIDSALKSIKYIESR